MIEVFEKGLIRLIRVENGYHILKNGEDFGQRAYIADNVAQINADIQNGIYIEESDDNYPFNSISEESTEETVDYNHEWRNPNELE